MAKGKGPIQGWITKNGVHIPIYGTYTVRGGVEPKAKGAKWGKKKKKELSPKQVRQATTYLSTSNKESIKAVKAELNKMDDSKEVFSGVTVKDLKEHFSGVDENTTLGEYRKQLFDRDDQDTPIKSETSDRPTKVKRDMKTGKVVDREYRDKDGKKRWESDKKAGVESGQEKDKYANRDWNKDVDDAKRYGYSEQSEEGKKPVTKTEEEKQARQSFRDKKAQEQGFADDASMRSYNEETGVNKETWKATPESYAQSKGKSIRDIAQEVNNNDAARAQANQLMKDGRTYEEAAALAHSDMERGVLKGQESSTSKISAKAQKVADNARKSLMFDKGYAEISPNHWSWAGMSNDKVVTALNASDSKYSYEIRTESEKGGPLLNNGTINHTRLYRTERGQASSTSKSKQDSLSASMNERSRIRGEFHAKDKAMKAAMPTTVSGLRSAYAEATGSMKSKIAAELRRKGYSLVGGKWVKGRKE